MKLGDNSKHGEHGNRMEKPEYSIPDRHAEGGVGDRPDGTIVHGTNYKQPWVENDPIAPDRPEEKIG